MGRFLLIATACGFALAGVPARSATIDTFAFMQLGWGASDNTAEGLTVGAADPGGILQGTFTGTVEPNGLILLADLTAFSDSYSDSAAKGIVGMGLADLTVFAYDATDGSGGLDMAGTYGKNQTCEGNAVPTTPDCNGSGSVVYTAGIDGAIFRAGLPLPSLLTLDQPAVTLVSSVTTPVPVIPEPSALSLAAVFGGLCAVAGWRRKREKSPAV
jgi:hypothetical protein